MLSKNTTNKANQNEHETFIRCCIDLAQKSMQNGDLPFGAVIVHNHKIISEAKNTAIMNNDITGHAEINAIKIAQKKHPNMNFAECTIYTTFEPCAMCSYIIRDIGIGEVVYSSTSPHLGGYSKWSILKDDIQPEFTTKAKTKNSPTIISGILKTETDHIYDNLKWKMHKF